MDIVIEKKFFSELNDDLRSIRNKVFVDEQGFQDEFDNVYLDQISVHLLVYIDGIAVATGRLFQKEPGSDVYMIGRVAVLPDYRNHHVGSLVLSILEEKAQEIGATSVELCSQCRVQGFYVKNGYKVIGDIYLDGDCPHIRMEKVI
ncbi:MAG: putative acyltransferase [Fusobacteria bacterium]|nr:MAG: putative acyltransferase [Fusobacteriota bacterium]KAF0229058.1 MAG: hypothetical protein FD182_1314 [Fusobacteriota bacterium]